MPTTAAPSAAQRRLLRQVRQRFVDGICAGLPELDKTVLDFLLKLAQQSGTARQMQSHGDALMQYRQLRSIWMECTGKAWQEALIPQLGGPRNPVAGSAGDPQFELLSDDVVENKILASRIALTVNEQVGQQFTTLRQCTQSLQGQELDSDDILRPDTVCLQLVEQWGQAGLSRACLQTVVDPLQRDLADLLQKHYQAINAFYAEQGVTPTDLRARVRRTESHAADSRSLTAQALAQALGHPGRSSGFGPGMPMTAFDHGMSTAFGPGMGMAAAFGSNRPAALRGDMPGGGAGVPGAWDGMPKGWGGMPGGAGAMPGSRDGMPRGWSAMPGGGAGMPGSWGIVPGGGGGGGGGGATMTPLAHTRQQAQGVIGKLRRLLFPLSPQVAMPTPASPVLAQALTISPAIGVDGMEVADGTGTADAVQLVGAVRQQSTDLKKKAATTAEKATIEVVALMFQSILSEERIPLAVRVLFARLQVPVLRVALAEPEFFSNLDHPARKLIDRMGACAMGFDAAAIDGSALAAEVRRVVQVIEQYPETGSRVFQMMHEEFERFLSKSLTEKPGTARLVSVAQQVEQKETLTIQYTIELRTMLRNMPVREEIRKFLFKTWAEVLALAAMRGGPQHADTIALKRTAATLVWAVGAKPQRSDRTLVIQNLPGLLQRLRQGLALLGVHGPAQDAQVKVLTDTLADAFQSKTALIPHAHIQAMARRLDRLEDFMNDTSLGEIQLNNESIEMLLCIDASSIHVVADNAAPVDDAMLAWAQELPLGHWYTLDHNGASVLVQYAWQSQRRQLHLFAAPDGSSYLIQLRRLAAYLQAGLLVFQDAEGLTMRATRNALAKLDANPERLLD